MVRSWSFSKKDVHGVCQDDETHGAPRSEKPCALLIVHEHPFCKGSLKIFERSDVKRRAVFPTTWLHAQATFVF